MAPITKQFTSSRLNTHPSEGPTTEDNHRRRLALLKRAGLFGTDTRGAEITRACTLEDLRQAYRLVYKTFVANGYIRPNRHGIRVRIFEATDDTATFVAKTAGKVVGVQSVVLDSADLGLPSDMAFGPEIDSLRAKGLRVCEATNEAILPDFRKTAVVTELMRCATAHSFLKNCDAAVTTVSPSHSGFYNLFGFRQLGQIRSYSSDIEDPVALMCLDLHELRRMDPTLGESQAFMRNFMAFTNPYIHAVKTWEDRARRHFRNPELLRELFLVDSDLLDACTDAQRQALRRRWGDELFAQVVDTGKTERRRWTYRYIPVRPARSNTRHVRRIVRASSFGRKIPGHRSG